MDPNTKKTTEFTFSPKVPISFAQLRGIMKNIMRHAQITDILMDVACDSKTGTGWHVVLHKRLTKKQASSVISGLSHYCKKLNLCTSKLTTTQLWWGITFQQGYLEGHEFIRTHVRIG